VSNQTVIVKLLDKDYQVACPPGQQAALQDSANYLDRQMRNIRANGKVIGLERIAVMAALNITNELLQNGEPTGDTNLSDTKAPNTKQLKGLNDKLEEALQRFRQLEIT
jgi:cell division protein ZapA